MDYRESILKFKTKIKYTGAKFANGFVIVMGILGVALGIRHTFFEQSMAPAIVGISSASVMYYLYRNPKILMIKSFDEFGDIFDESRDKKYIWGAPFFQLLILFSILYIWLT